MTRTTHLSQDESIALALGRIYEYRRPIQWALAFICGIVQVACFFSDMTMTTAVGFAVVCSFAAAGMVTLCHDASGWFLLWKFVFFLFVSAVGYSFCWLLVQRIEPVVSALPGLL